MLHRLLRRRRARSSKTRFSDTYKSRACHQPEALELRALLAANPIGDALLVGGSVPGARARRLSPQLMRWSWASKVFDNCLSRTKPGRQPLAGHRP